MLSFLVVVALAQTFTFQPPVCILSDGHVTVDVLLQGEGDYQVRYALACGSSLCTGVRVGFAVSADGGIPVASVMAIGGLQLKSVRSTMAVITWGGDHQQFLIDFKVGKVTFLSGESLRMEGLCRPTVYAPPK